MHEAMTEKVIRANIVFFDSNPIGRITTRFSKDTVVTDMGIPGMTLFVTKGIMRAISVFITISIINPYLFIIIGLALAYMIYVTKQGIRPMIDSQKFEQIFYGPINTTLSMQISGISTLRAYRKFDYFMTPFMHAIEKSGNATFGFVSSSRWLSLRLDCICLSVGFVTALFCVLFKDHIPRELLISCLQIITDTVLFFGVAIRMLAELQNMMTSP
jgi:ABC-type multidrug transport system fused ATPase/permease subunit